MFVGSEGGKDVLAWVCICVWFYKMDLIEDIRLISYICLGLLIRFQFLSVEGIKALVLVACSFLA